MYLHRITVDEENHKKYKAEEVMYWRKDNQIYKWFDNRIETGIQNCAEYVIEREDLEALLKACNEVIATPEEAPDILPTREGFFFGDTEYGEWYMDGVQETATKLQEILDEDKDSPDVHYKFHAWY